jgi:hypothetical protein
VKRSRLSELQTQIYGIRFVLNPARVDVNTTICGNIHSAQCPEHLSGPRGNLTIPRRTNGSPPVIRTLFTPSSVRIRTIRNISS